MNIRISTSQNRAGAIFLNVPRGQGPLQRQRREIALRRLQTSKASAAYRPASAVAFRGVHIKLTIIRRPISA